MKLDGVAAKMLTQRRSTGYVQTGIFQNFSNEVNDGGIIGDVAKISVVRVDFNAAFFPTPGPGKFLVHKLHCKHIAMKVRT